MDGEKQIIYKNIKRKRFGNKRNEIPLTGAKGEHPKKVRT